MTSLRAVALALVVCTAATFGATEAGKTPQTRSSAAYYFVQSGLGFSLSENGGNGTYVVEVYNPSLTTAWFRDAPRRNGGIDPTAVWLDGFMNTQYSQEDPINAAISIYWPDLSGSGQRVVLVELWEGELSDDNSTLTYSARLLEGDEQTFAGLWPTWREDLASDKMREAPVSLFIDGGCLNSGYKCRSPEYDKTCGCLENVPMYYVKGACQSCGSTDEWCEAAFGGYCSAAHVEDAGVDCMDFEPSDIYDCSTQDGSGIGDCSAHNC